MRSVRLKLLLFFRYRINNTRMQRFLEKRIAALSGGYYYSTVIRELYKELHGLVIGYGTYGGCWNNSALWGRGIKIGRYCSFAGDIYIGTGNHPMDIFTTHPITYDTWCAGANGKYTPPQRPFVWYNDRKWCLGWSKCDNLSRMQNDWKWSCDRSW